jgi:hypothetical protein
MKTSLIIFGVTTILYTLVTVLMVWFGFEYDRLDWVEFSREFHAFGWTFSYISLAILLLIDLIHWILKK